MIRRLLLFGATGDLASRFLFPAMAELLELQSLPADFEVVGAATTAGGDAQLRRHVARALQEHAARVPASGRDNLLRRLRYQRVDFSDTGTVADVIGAVAPESGEPVAAYLALPPTVYPAALDALIAIGLPQGSRLAMEKPFGEDLNAAITLNEQIRRVPGIAGEDAVFRVDHVLGMATVHNLLGARLANRVLEAVWNSSAIERVDILWDEGLALEGRAGYYDTAGALKDVIQNHLLQILCLFAMEAPLSLGADDIHARKVEVLRSIRRLDVNDVQEVSRRGRYTAGFLPGPEGHPDREVPAYVAEDGVDPARGTETYAEVALRLDTWRWVGTDFRLRAGKALARRRKGVIVRFRPVPRLPFAGTTAPPPPNELRIGLDGPESLSLHLTGSAPGPPAHLAPLVLTAELPAKELTAYSYVLLRVLQGEGGLFVSGDEAELSWAIVTPIIEAWQAGAVPLLDYPAGSSGPPRL